MPYTEVVGPWNVVTLTGRLFGVFPFDGRFRLSPPLAVYGIMVALVPLASAFFLVFSRFFKDDSYLHEFLNSAELLFLSFTLVACCVAPVVQRSHVTALMEEFEVLDRLIEVQPRFDGRRTLLVHLANFCCLAGAFYQEYNPRLTSLSKVYVFCCYATMLVIYSMEAVLVSYIRALRAFLISLSETVILQQREDGDKGYLFYPRLKQKLVVLQRVSYAYNRICRATERVNRIYSAQTLLAVSSLFLLLSENAYVLNKAASSLTKSWSYKSFDFLKEVAFWVLWWTSIIWSIIANSVATRHEAGRQVKITENGKSMRTVSNKIFPTRVILRNKGVYTALRSAFFASQIMGLHPYRKDMSRSVGWTLYTVCFSALCLLIPFHFSFKLGIGKQSWYKSELEVTFTKGLLFALFGALGVSVLCSFTVKDGLERALKAIQRADGLLAKRGHPFCYKGWRSGYKPLTRALLIVGSWAVENLAIRLYDIDISSSMYFFVLLGFADTWSFAAVIRVIARHAEVLAEELRDPGNLRRRLDILVEVYAELCDASDALSEAFSWKRVISIGALLLCSTAQLFYLRRGLVHLVDGEFSIKDVAFLLFMIMVGSLLSMQLFDTVTPCTEAANQGEKFNNLLYKLMIEDKTKELSNNVKLRLHMTVKRKVQFTAGGFLPLDYSLVHSMSAAVTTYFIILLQFSPPEKN